MLPIPSAPAASNQQQTTMGLSLGQGVVLGSPFTLMQFVPAMSIIYHHDESGRGVLNMVELDAECLPQNYRTSQFAMCLQPIGMFCMQLLHTLYVQLAGMLQGSGNPLQVLHVLSFVCKHVNMMCWRASGLFWLC
jgi:hypothetical protein